MAKIGFGNEYFISKAKSIVCNYINEHQDLKYEIDPSKLYVLWYGNALLNHKIIIGSYIPDDIIYVVVYDGTKEKFYLDIYGKIDNKIIDNF